MIDTLRINCICNATNFILYFSGKCVSGEDDSRGISKHF